MINVIILSLISLMC